MTETPRLRWSPLPCAGFAGPRRDTSDDSGTQTSDILLLRLEGSPQPRGVSSASCVLHGVDLCDEARCTLAILVQKNCKSWSSSFIKAALHEQTGKQWSVMFNQQCLSSHGLYDHVAVATGCL